jgi:hypothetical protein
MRPGALVVLIAHALAALAAPAHADMTRDAAVRILQERHALVVSRDSGSYRGVLALPILGDQDQLRVALAAFQLREFMGGDELGLLRRHLSRLVAENLLGRPPTRVKDVASALAFERSEGASFTRLQQEAFQKLVETSLPPPGIIRGDTGLPVVLVAVQQAARGDLEVTGELRVRIPQAQGAGEPWERGCMLRPASQREWSQAAGGGRSANVPCQGFFRDEQAGDFDRALERVRTGQAKPEIVPFDVMVLPTAVDASLPYEPAVELLSRGGCSATGNCQQAFIDWLKRWGPAKVVFGFFAAQLAAAALLFWLSTGAPLSRASRRVKWSLAYLALVVLAHVAMVATSLHEGALLLLMGWYVLGLPLFLPGFLLGLTAISWAFRDAALRPAKILLGVLAVTAPLLEWLLMSGLLRSGYLGG